jgi:hypothetical protein
MSKLRNTVGSRLWKRYAAALGNRLWKRYVTACLITYRVRQLLMETVLALPKSLEPQHRQLRL